MTLGERAESVRVSASTGSLLRPENLRDFESTLQGPRELEELLPLALEQILEFMHSDTAAVLLLDPKSDQLLARAACGLEEEVRQGVRIPVGTGFAGRIAAERRPVILDRVDASTVANPILWQKGIQSMLGVPLIAGHTLVGVLHVGSFGRHAFDEKQVAVLEDMAKNLAIAIEAGSALSERRAAGVLQRSLLPSALPKHAHIEFASRYAPAERGDVGGDWYDAFELPSGDVWVMTGDIAGHGLNPAIIMGRLRSAMRAYALLGMSPEDVLRGANRKLTYFEPDAMATVICGVIAPPFDEIRLCSAGHPPAVLIQPGREAQLLGTGAAPPLGTVAELEVQPGQFPLIKGSVLVLYTDGLVERRDEAITDGLERLRCAVQNESPDRLCGRIMDAMVGGSVPADDVAVLALRVSPERPSRVHRSAIEDRPETTVLRSDLFACEPASVRAARRFVLECVEVLGLRRLLDIQLVVSELATNAVVHAQSPFDVVVERTNVDAVRIEIRDFGGGEPIFSPAPGGFAEAESVEGRGLRIVELLAQQWGVEWRPGGRGKSVWFVMPMDALAELRRPAARRRRGPASTESPRKR